MLGGNGEHSGTSPRDGRNELEGRGAAERGGAGQTMAVAIKWHIHILEFHPTRAAMCSSNRRNTKTQHGTEKSTLSEVCYFINI